VPTIDRDALSRLLDQSDNPLASECAAAVRNGDETRIWEAAEVPASHLAGIYQRRAEHVRRISLDVRGIEEAALCLQEAESQSVGLAIVQGLTNEYLIFLNADGAGVIACLAIPRADSGNA
jgi:hypothetical protein